MKPVRLWVTTGALLLAGATVAAYGSPAGAHTAPRSASPAPHAALNCEYSSLCTEVANSAEVFGSEYVGHDEPSTLFYSNQPASGNRMRYNLSLPKDPPAGNPNAPGKGFHFELNSAFWFGMAMCATAPYPPQASTGTPDRHINVVDPSLSPPHPGTSPTYR